MATNYNYPVLTPVQFRFFRIQSGLTQEGLMEVFGVASKSTVWRWEHDSEKQYIETYKTIKLIDHIGHPMADNIIEQWNKKYPNNQIVKTIR